MTRTSLSRRSLVAGAVSSGLVRPALTRSQSTPVATGGMLRVGLSELPTLWDPLGSSDFNTLWLSTLVYDTLLQIDTDGSVVPGLALFASWSADGLTLTIDLRGNIRFSDGTPVTPADVVASLERVRAHSWRLESVTSIEELPDNSVRIVTAALDSALIASLASPEVAILPAGAPDFAADIAAGRPPLGTGPFRPLRLRDEDIRLLPNDWYWQIGRPKLGAVRITGMPEESARSTALLTGSVDLLPDIPLLDAALIRQEPSLKLVGNTSVLGCMLILNLRQPPMSVASFRLLINRAIDREALVAAATANEATPRHLPIPADHWAALDDTMEPGDPEALRREFRDLGYPVGLRLRMVSDERNVSLSNAAVFLQEQFAFIGIALTVDLLDAEALAATLDAEDFDIFATSIDAWRDPHELFRPLVMADGPRNVGGYASARCDRLVRSGVMVAGAERRAPYYQQLQRILLQDVPFVVLYLQNYFDSMTTLLQDYPMYPPISGLGMRHAWLARPSREAESWVPVAEHLKETDS
jgi:peptide/nickel transport system substrate-binding protein